MKRIFTLLLLALSSVTRAQTVCDSLEILDVHYAPFNDTMIQVHLYNHSTSIFSYPQFTIFDSNGDTVAKEQINFFGIGGESRHSLDIYPGMPPSQVFSGSMELFYTTVDSYAVCTWNAMNFDLCPDTCKMFFLTLANIGGAQVLGDAHWEILDANSQQVADGIFTLDTMQMTVDSACLGPGSYTMKVHNVSLTPGGQKVINITDYTFSNNPDTTFNDTVAILPFTLYAPCFTPVSVKKIEKKTGVIGMHSYNSAVFIKNTAGEAIGNVSIYSMDGKVIQTESIAKSQYSFDLSSLPHNMYIVRVVNNSGTYTHKVITGQ